MRPLYQRPKWPFALTAAAAPSWPRFEGLHHLQGTTGRCLEDWIQARGCGGWRWEATEIYWILLVDYNPVTFNGLIIGVFWLAHCDILPMVHKRRTLTLSRFFHSTDGTSHAYPMGHVVPGAIFWWAILRCSVLDLHGNEAQTLLNTADQQHVNSLNWLDN
jgi:hypothetical protein